MPADTGKENDVARFEVASERDVEEALAAISAWVAENKPSVRMMARHPDYALVHKASYASVDGLADALASTARGAMLNHLRKRGFESDDA